MKNMPSILLISVCLGLAACQSGAGREEPSSGAASLCLQSDCNQYQIIDLPQLENVHFSADGRLFLSGQENLYELVGSAAEGYQAKALLDGAGCSGLSSARNTLYALCQGGGAVGATDFGTLFALDLLQPDALPQAIFQLSGMTLPNGMGLGPDGHLYISDGPISVEPKIVRLSVSAEDPQQITGQETWIRFFADWPNGLAWVDGVLYTTLYGSGLGSVVGIPLQADGSAGAPTTIYTRGRIMDDLIAYENSLIVTDWQDSRLFHISLQGELLAQTPAFGFRQPSSIAVGQAPLFRPDQLLITERYSGNGLWLLENPAEPSTP